MTLAMADGAKPSPKPTRLRDAQRPSTVAAIIIAPLGVFPVGKPPEIYWDFFAVFPTKCWPKQFNFSHATVDLSVQDGA
jgi:hypothetical protein